MTSAATYYTFIKRHRRSFQLDLSNLHIGWTLIFPAAYDDESVCPHGLFTICFIAVSSMLYIVSHLIYSGWPSVWVCCDWSCIGLGADGSRITIDNRPDSRISSTKCLLRLVYSGKSFLRYYWIDRIDWMEFFILQQCFDVSGYNAVSLK